MARGAAFGLLEHPKDGVVTLASPISHALTSIVLEGDEVHGTLTILNTPEGDRLKAYIQGGYKPTVSLRGFGSLVRAADGVDDVQNDFICEGWDVVFTPSFKDAQLNVDGPKNSDPALATIVGESTATPAPAAAAPATPAATPISTQPTPATQATHTPTHQHTVMDKPTIVSRIASMESINPTQLDAGRYATSIAELGALHENVAAFAAEDPKRSWEAQQLHSRISTVETKMATAFTKPAADLKRVSETQGKLTRVLKSVVETGLKYKSKLAESRANAVKTKRLVEDVANRGRGWKTLAEKQEVKLRLIEKRYGIALEMLDKLAETYKNDNTALGRRVIELEFPEQVKDPKIAEALSKAVKPKDVAAVRESIEKKTKPVTESQETPAPAAEGTPAPAAEGTPAPTSAAEGTPAAAEGTPAPVSESSVIVIESRGKPGSISESIALAKRLSVAQATVAA